jgi:hypothetical protein
MRQLLTMLTVLGILAVPGRMLAQTQTLPSAPTAPRWNGLPAESMPEPPTAGYPLPRTSYFRPLPYGAAPYDQRPYTTFYDLAAPPYNQSAPYYSIYPTPYGVFPYYNWYAPYGTF